MDPAVLPAGRPWQELHFPCGIIPTGFPGGLVVKNLSALQSLGQEGLLEKEMTTTPVSLPGQFHGEDPGSLQSMGFKESDTTFIIPIASPNQGFCGSAAHRLMTGA